MDFRLVTQSLTKSSAKVEPGVKLSQDLLFPIIPTDKLSQFRHGRARSGHYLPYCFLEQKLMNAGMDDRQTVGRGFRRTTNQLPRIRIRKLNPSQLNRIEEMGMMAL